LRDTYRKDLSLYVLPLEPKKGTKRKLTGTTHPDEPKAKKGIPTSKIKKTKKGTLTSKKAKKQPPPKFQRKGKELGQIMSNLIRNHIVVMMIS